MIPVTYGYARVSKADRDEKNLETQLRELEAYGVRRDLIFSDEGSGRSSKRPGWQALLQRVRARDTVVVVWLDRFSRDFEEGVALQSRFTADDIGIVAIRENIDTADGSASAKLYRRMMLAQGAYQADSTGERIRAGQDRARASGQRIGRKPRLSAEDVDHCIQLLENGATLRAVARFKGCSPATVRRAVERTKESA